MSRVRRWIARHGLDLLIVVIAAETAVATALSDATAHPDGPAHWLTVVVVTGAVLTLLARHRYPFAAPATMWATCAAVSVVDGQVIAAQAGVFLAGMGAAVLLGNQRSARRAYVGLALVLSGAALVVVNDLGASQDELLTIPLLFGIGWLIGFALRERTERTEAAEERARRAEREREVAARVAVAEERARIARELHDVVAHSMSVMVLQVGAVRHRMPDSAARERDALRNVEGIGRDALTEMRRLLGAMRDDGDEAVLTPHPRLAELDHLAHTVTAAGLAVDVRIEGDPVPLPAGLDLSAYRIVQEGLTNSLKHSGAARVTVTVGYGPTDLLLEVRDDGRVARAPAAGDGHGLAGIRERVKIYGGEMSAGPAPGGGFLVRARLPVGDEPG